MNRTNSILWYLKRKNPGKDEENVASDSGVGSNVNNSQKMERLSDIQDKNYKG